MDWYRVVEAARISAVKISLIPWKGGGTFLD
jgi:hypothetical protein